MQSLKRSADEAGLFGTETPLDPFTLEDSSDEGTPAKRHQEDNDSKMDKELAALELAELQAAAKERRDRAEKEIAQAAAAKAAEEAKEAERKRQEELQKAEQINKAKKERIAELKKKALQRKAEAIGLPTTDLTVNKGTRYEETFKVVWPFVSLLANGGPIDRMDMIEKVEGFLSTDESCEGMWGRLGSLGSQLYTFQYGKVNGNWVLRVMYDSYVPDCNDEGPHDDDQSDRGENSYFAYFDVDMYGRVDNFDAITDTDVEALDESNEWVTIHSD